VEFPGAIYHVMDRGGRREDIFVDDGKGETAEQKGKRVIAEELARLGWQESNLASRRKAHPDKLAIALRLRNETTLSIKWIVTRVRIGFSKVANRGGTAQPRSDCVSGFVSTLDRVLAARAAVCERLSSQ
jgi:hypothetical protein